ncbi:PchX [Pseudomonas sp. Os17]|uniref:hypothetical protein n=1 Tax=Pseudomonas TaxID=286 RepID=UPI0005FC87B7|nr:MULTISPECIES: hypothetical protein [Pseudomonas]RXU61829.1 hypothetical protein CW358_23515 [Pseudomonas protegens]BAQ76834.1 PchX [Pseudomonas sp. Os17]
MNIERRALLKGMALGGLASVAVTGPGLSLANGVLGPSAGRRLPTLALVSPAVADSAFVQGINASSVARQVSVQRWEASLASIQALQQRLGSGQRQRIIGLLDDASAALVLDQARSAGARVQWLGQHHSDARTSRHQLLGTTAAHGCALQLGLQLNACGAGFSLSEQRLLAQPAFQAGARARDPRSAEQWAATLGYSLAELASGRLGQAPLASPRAVPLSGHFVSFSIEA